MKRFQPRSFSSRAKAGFYGIHSFLGGLIRNSSLLMLILCLGLTVAAAAVDTAKSFWRHPGVRSFVAALESELADIGSSAADLNAQPPSQFKDHTKAQRDENRERRRLAAELRQGKASASSIKEVRLPGGRI